MYNQAELETISTVEEAQMFIDFKPNRQNKSTHKIKTFKIVSLFSGCGGLDLGFSGNFNFRDRYFDKTKFKIEFSNDIDPAAELVYNANTSFLIIELHCEDIKKIDFSKIPDFDFYLQVFLVNLFQMQD